jgi:4-carboxymuconolactone decarboxylase
MKTSKTTGLLLLAGFAGMLLGAVIDHAEIFWGRVSAVAAANETPLPKDVNAESRNRLPPPKREDMDAYGKKIFDELTGPRISWTKQVPLRLYSPRLAKPMSDAHYYLKFGTGLGDRLTEIAVLVTSRELNNQFEWTQWEIHARMAGPGYVEPGIIDIIKYNKPVTGLGEKETAIIQFGRELIGQRRVSPETFATTLRLFGPRGTVDLTNLMALYNATALELIAFDQQLLEGQKPLLPLR